MASWVPASVIVRGTLTTRSWESEAGRRSAPQIRATAVGPNLARGWSDFHRPARPAQAVGQETGAVPESEPTPEDEQLARELADELTGQDYGSGSGSLYEVDSENSSPEPAHA